VLSLSTAPSQQDQILPIVVGVSRKKNSPRFIAHKKSTSAWQIPKQADANKETSVLDEEGHTKQRLQNAGLHAPVGSSTPPEAAEENAAVGCGDMHRPKETNGGAKAKNEHVSSGSSRAGLGLQGVRSDAFTPVGAFTPVQQPASDSGREEDDPPNSLLDVVRRETQNMNVFDDGYTYKEYTYIEGARRASDTPLRSQSAPGRSGLAPKQGKAFSQQIDPKYFGSQELWAVSFPIRQSHDNAPCPSTSPESHSFNYGQSGINRTTPIQSATQFDMKCKRGKESSQRFKRGNTNTEPLPFSPPQSPVHNAEAEFFSHSLSSLSRLEKAPQQQDRAYKIGQARNHLKPKHYFQGQGPVTISGGSGSNAVPPGNLGLAIKSRKAKQGAQQGVFGAMRFDTTPPSSSSLRLLQVSMSMPNFHSGLSEIGAPTLNLNLTASETPPDVDDGESPLVPKLSPFMQSYRTLESAPRPSSSPSRKKKEKSRFLESAEVDLCAWDTSDKPDDIATAFKLNNIHI
jgi:hypothetical protein